MFEFRDLFQWDRFITPTIIKTFYWLVIALIGLFGISGIFSSLAAMAISPFGGFILLLILYRQRYRRNDLFAHRRGIHSDRVPHQRASRRDPRPGADALNCNPETRSPCALEG